MSVRMGPSGPGVWSEMHTLHGHRSMLLAKSICCCHSLHSSPRTQKIHLGCVRTRPSMKLRTPPARRRHPWPPTHQRLPAPKPRAAWRRAFKNTCVGSVCNQSIAIPSIYRVYRVDSLRSSLRSPPSPPVHQSTTESTHLPSPPESTGVHRVDGGLFTPQRQRLARAPFSEEPKNQRLPTN